MRLSKYKKKREDNISSEPLGKIKKTKSKNLIFVIQEHHARRHHYDLRLEAGGVLKSWAVPKQPTLNPEVKRLAIQVEDHTYAYKDFEGTIASGYGAGSVKIWDHGTYSVDATNAAESEKKILEGIKKGMIHFTLQGEKLQGLFHLIKLKNSERDAWLLIKKKEHPKEANLTNLNKIFWPKENLTKGDLLRYYSKVAKWILPYLKDRPQSLKRFPNGIEGTSFFQKNLKKHPDWIETIEIKHKNKGVNYLLIQNEESLLYAGNLGCIEIHPFFSRLSKLQYPDFLVFDLDPKSSSFLNVITVAQTLHKVLENFHVKSYCKTSGATGLHIAVPLGAKYTYEQAKKFAELIATIVQKKIPKICTLERSISKRQGKVYIDCYQNNFGQTIAAPYSIRARPGAPVSTPLKWSEVKKGLDPKKFTIKNLFNRLKKYGDLFSPVLENGINMELILKNIEIDNQ